MFGWTEAVLWLIDRGDELFEVLIFNGSLSGEKLIVFVLALKVFNELVSVFWLSRL